LSEGGFTLLELILATAIGAIVLIVINTTFFAALRLHNTTHQKIDDDLVIQRTLGIVRKDLAGIMVPANPTATTNTLSGQLTTEATSTNELDSTSERVTPDIYTSSGKIDGWTPYADVQMVSYYLSPTPGGASTKDLVRVVTRNLLAANDTTVDAQTLLTGVSSVAMSYFDGENWLDTWDSTTSTSLPSAIKFSLALAPRTSDASANDNNPIELVVPVIVKTTATLQQEAAATTGQQ
jgi:type II secretion system protein J